jgi:hypothetical protein
MARAEVERATESVERLGFSTLFVGEERRNARGRENTSLRNLIVNGESLRQFSIVISSSSA